MKISSEFSKFASSYNSYNIIQNKVIDRLLSKISTEPKNILDIGCGNGALIKKIDWEYQRFVGVDFAKGMLELHPTSKNIELIYGDFNDDAIFQKLSKYRFDYLFSASALQWADNLEKVFQHLVKLDVKVNLAIFTSNTFKTLNQTAGLTSILKSAEHIKTLQERYFDASVEVVTYKLEFNSTRELFRYIKKSGVSGVRKVLSYKEMKSLMINYPVNYLEFEVIFISTS